MDEREAFIEKLEAAHTFPCAYTFKLIGDAETQLRARALALIEASVEGADPSASVRESAKGNHVAVTIVAHMPDAETVARLYREFHELDGLAMLL